MPESARRNSDKNSQQLPNLGLSLYKLEEDEILHVNDIFLHSYVEILQKLGVYVFFFANKNVSCVCQYLFFSCL